MAPTPPRMEFRIHFAIAALAALSFAPAAQADDGRGEALFGLCVQCAGEIEAERLTAVPHATHCRRCAPGS